MIFEKLGMFYEEVTYIYSRNLDANRCVLAYIQYIETVLDRPICTKDISFEEEHYLSTTRYTIVTNNI